MVAVVGFLALATRVIRNGSQPTRFLPGSAGTSIKYQLILQRPLHPLTHPRRWVDWSNHNLGIADGISGRYIASRRTVVSQVRFLGSTIGRQTSRTLVSELSHDIDVVFFAAFVRVAEPAEFEVKVVLF